MAHILPQIAERHSGYGPLLDVACACLAFLLPWALVKSYTLHFFYLIGAATLLDSGWFVALTTHGKGLALPNPAIIRAGSFYATHMSPLLALIRMVHDRVWQGFDAVWFSAVQGVWYGLIGLAVWLAVRRAAPSLALPTALLTALGGVELATLGFPHFEVAMPALILLFLALFGHARNPWALLLLPLLLAVREDAGLHAACLLALIGWHFALTRDQASRYAERVYLLLAALLIASALISIVVRQHYFGGGDNTLDRVYLGSPPLTHITLPFLEQRLVHVVRQRLYIFLPVAMIVFTAVWMRDRLLLLGPLACVPWLMLAMIAVVQDAGTLKNYYAFPFIVALAWPALCLAFRTLQERRLVRLQIVGAHCRYPSCRIARGMRIQHHGPIFCRHRGRRSAAPRPCSTAFLPRSPVSAPGSPTMRRRRCG